MALQATNNKTEKFDNRLEEIIRAKVFEEINRAKVGSDLKFKEMKNKFTDLEKADVNGKWVAVHAHAAALCASNNPTTTTRTYTYPVQVGKSCANVCAVEKEKCFGRLNVEVNVARVTSTGNFVAFGQYFTDCGRSDWSASRSELVTSESPQSNWFRYCCCRYG